MLWAVMSGSSVGVGAVPVDGGGGGGRRRPSLGLDDRRSDSEFSPPGARGTPSPFPRLPRPDAMLPVSNAGWAWRPRPALGIRGSASTSGLVCEWVGGGDAPESLAEEAEDVRNNGGILVGANRLGRQVRHGSQNSSFIVAVLRTTRQGYE